MRWQGRDDRQDIGRQDTGEDDLVGVFEDLELQAEGLHLADRAVEVDELSVAQYAEIRLASRLLASVGRDIRLVTSGPDVRGRLADVGADWAEVEGADRATWVVQLHHVEMLVGLADGALPEEGRPFGSGLSLRSVLRGFVEERASRAWHLAGERTLHAVAMRVGVDFVELRVDDGAGQVTVPLASVVAVRDRR